MLLCGVYLNMGTYVDSPTDSREGTLFPAYGPVDSVLSFAAFYVFVQRATPTIVEIVTTSFPNVSDSSVRLWLAVLLWVILAVTVLDQARRQLAALGVGSRVAVNHSERERGVPSGMWVFVYITIVLAGGTIAALTFTRAIDTGISILRIIPTMDVAALSLIDIVLLILFFVSFGAATRALDRLAIGGIRVVLSV